MVKLATPLHAAFRNLSGSRLQVCPPAPLRPSASLFPYISFIPHPFADFVSFAVKEFQAFNRKDRKAREESKTVQRTSS